MQVAVASSGPIRLADGRWVWLRPLRAEDGPRLIDLCRRLSAETLRRRFLRERPMCDPHEADELAAVDQQRQVAFAAVPEPEADGPIVAVGRFHGDGTGRAELALVVEDGYQRLGLGRVLLRRLILEARRQRLRFLDGYTFFTNTPALRLLRASGQPLDVRHYSGNVLEIHLAIGAPQGNEAAELEPGDAERQRHDQQLQRDG
jgi:acetyltransferase